MAKIKGNKKDNKLKGTKKNDKILYYDKDGTGSGASVQVARIVGAITALEVADFLIVSEV
jgi:hypothetical protein